ncbi:MAG: hypothetical protein AAFR12_02460 [Cyanobacteria bacterium J06626_6]
MIQALIIGRENSDIVANAADGRDGNINIITQGIFGLQFRSQLTPQSDITASSQIGIDGTVKIENAGLDADSGLMTLPAYFSDEQANHRLTQNVRLANWPIAA